MDDAVARLLREERVIEAAELAKESGDASTASALFERACDWKRAAEEALRAGDAARALPLAVMANDDAIAEAALPIVAANVGATENVARLLERRGDASWTARLYEAARRNVDAARAWDRAGDAPKAAALLEAAGDVIGAARVLEAAMRREPLRFLPYVALGALLLRYGKADAAARALQKVPAGSAERRGALTHLVRALEQLGLGEATREASRELDALGGPSPEPTIEEAASHVQARIFGRYEVIREVASSAAARVLECTDTVRGEHVAVKIFAGYDARGAGRDALARFEREVRVLAALDHPNVVPLREYVPEGPAIVLAWMAGGTLETMIAERSIAPARAVEIACAVLAALGEAHRLGVLHRDVKPANVLFDDAGVARLGDFGVAHLGDLTATATAGVIGTFAYMSPEQREGRPATVQSDLYGTGALLFEMLTGERPTSASAARARPSGAHRDLGTKHDDVVLAMIAADPADRPSDAFAARRALTSLRWPSVVEPAAPRGKERAPSERPQAGRVETALDGGTIDRWLGRPFEAIPLDDHVLARASAFARATHPALQAVLRVDRDRSQIWLEIPRGRPMDAALLPSQAAALRDAVDALHAHGGVHGSIDRAHVLVAGDGHVTLRFEAAIDPTATIDRDRLALARLGAKSASPIIG